MSSWPEPASFHDAPPKTVKYCRTCHKVTPHEIRSGEGVLALICVPCLRRKAAYLQDRIEEIAL